MDKLEASFANERKQLPGFVVDRLHSPIIGRTELLSTEKLSLKLFLISTSGSDMIYSETCAAIMEHHPEDELFSLWQSKRRLEEITGIVEMKHDMCIDSCVGFTGPFANMEACPECGKARYTEGARSQQKPRKQFTTVPLAMQLQALFSTDKGAKAMQYSYLYTTKLLENLRNESFQENRNYSDFFDGDRLD